MQRLMVSVVVTGVVMLGTGFRSAVAAPPTDMEDRIRTAVQALTDEAIATDGGVGLSVAVSIGDRIIVGDGYGLAEVEHNVLANRETMFRIGSITKQFAAAGIMRLVETGAVNLDEPFTTYLPDYPVGDRVVTVRHLLTHTSGIKSYTSLGPVWQEKVARDLPDKELVDLFKDEPFDFEPGADWNYNNSGYYLLGMIIEAASGTPWSVYLQDTFFTPLQLMRTRGGSNADIIHNRAQGYRVVDGTLANDALIGMTQPGAAGALLSTATDLLHWQDALIHGRVVSSASYEMMRTPYVLADGTNRDYGFGLMTRDVLERPCVAHGGGIFGFNSMLQYFPDEQLGIAVLSNSEACNAGLLARRIAMAALEYKPSSAPLPDGIESRLDGTYTVEGMPRSMTFSVRDGMLVTTMEGETEPLAHQGDGEFHRPDQPQIRFTIDLTGDGPIDVITITLPNRGFTLRRNAASDGP